MTVARTLDATGMVLMAKAVDIFPARITKVAGTGAALFVDVSKTLRPPVGAGPLIDTVAVAEAPPSRLPGAIETATT